MEGEQCGTPQGVRGGDLFDVTYECTPGEDAKAIAAQRPNSEFDPFILRCLMFICRPMCMPLMLATLDYSGATFMNVRIAYQEAWDNWKDEQNLVHGRRSVPRAAGTTATWFVSGSGRSRSSSRKGSRTRRFHELRAAFATSMIEKFGLSRAADLLGHSSVETTDAYLSKTR